MDTVTLKSPDDGSILIMQVTERREGEVEFEVSVRTPWFSGRAPASTFMNGSPSAMFNAMALEWRGWAGERSWQDLDRRVSFSATSDSTGHISIVVVLTGHDYDSCLRVVLRFEAGQLDDMAFSVGEALG